MEERLEVIKYTDKKLLKVEFSYLIFNVENFNKEFEDLTDDIQYLLKTLG